MSRISTLMPGLQLVEPSSESLERTSRWEDMTSSEWRRPTSSWPARESPRTLQCSERSRIVVSDGFPSLSSPFGSIAVH